MQPASFPKKHLEALIPLAVFLVAAFTLAQFGFEQRLHRDHAFYMYEGQQFVRGIPPLVSAVDSKTPLAPILIGFAVHAANLLGMDDLLAARISFWLIASLSIAAVYLLAVELFQSRMAGLLSAAMFVAFEPFAREATSGPREKIPMVLFQTLALWLTAQGRWFWAGFTGALAFLAWQPTIIYPLAVFFLAYYQTQPGSERKSSLRNALVGFAIPVIAMFAYYLARNALPDLVYFAFLFPLSELVPSRAAGGLAGFAKIGQTLFRGEFHLTYWAVLTSLAIAPIFYARRAAQAGGWREVLRRDKFAGLLLTLPLPFLWSWIDFQGEPDLFIILPYTAILLTWLVDSALLALSRGDAKGTFVRAGNGLIVVGVVLYSFYSYAATVYTGLNSQRDWAYQAESYLTNPDDELVVLGRPEILILLHRTNRYRYVSIFAGVTSVMERESGLSTEAWLENEFLRGPKVIAPGDRFEPVFERLVLENGYPYEKVVLGEWVIFVRQD